MPEVDLPEQMKVRRGKREALLADGDAYAVGVPLTHTVAEVREQWAHLQTGEETQDEVGVAGRVVFVRNTGSLCFATLQAGDGTRLQAMLSSPRWGRSRSTAGSRSSTWVTTSSSTAASSPAPRRACP